MRLNSSSEGTSLALMGKKQRTWSISPISRYRNCGMHPNRPYHTLGRSPTLTTDRAKRPPLPEPAATGQELTSGDRVEGLGNFGRPTGEFGTVERTNDEDAVVKWDDDVTTVA
jgi:hypothetical protein